MTATHIACIAEAHWYQQAPTVFSLESSHCVSKSVLCQHAAEKVPLLSVKEVVALQSSDTHPA